MTNVNTEVHKVVKTESVFLFTKRHLKVKFPQYFVDEESTYFFTRHNRVRVLEVHGDKCCEYEKYDDSSLDRLAKDRQSTAAQFLIIQINHVVQEYSQMSVYWTDRTVGNPRDASQYQHGMSVDGVYFEEFTTWLTTYVPGVHVEIIDVRL